MLILKRKIDEEIKIGSDITIKILSVSDSQIKIGIEAPKNVEIYRGELYDKVKESVLEAREHSKQKPEMVANFKINKVRK